MQLAGKIIVDDEVVKAILLITAIGATLSCVVGYFLSLEGGYDEDQVTKHQWQGIWFATFSWLLWFSRNNWLNQKFTFIKFLYRPLLVITSILMIITGHLGANLTHGETYLFDNMPQPLRAWLRIPPKTDRPTSELPSKITNVNNAKVYEEIIHPIFKQKCEKCHNKNKMKGELRMDEVALIQKGGKNGVIFKAHNVEESEFIKRILLPESDEHHMPPKGKTQITENELFLMKWWVEQGASFDKKVSQLTVNESIKQVLTTLGGGINAVNASVGLVVKQNKFDLEDKIIAQDVPKIDDKVAEEIKKTGALILPFGQNNNYVEISYLNNSKLTDNEATVVSKAPQQTLWLKLSNTQITDKTLVEVAKLQNLTRLHLEKTKITDNGLLQLKPIQNLEYLNLIGTQITDEGLQTLASMKSLKKIYLWQTKVTQTGANQLQKALPDLIIDLGISEQQIIGFFKDTTKSNGDIYKKCVVLK